MSLGFGSFQLVDHSHHVLETIEAVPLSPVAAL
jgi:hypothetical protein